jgi:hypothetical protein
MGWNIDELFARMLAGNYDDEWPWEAVRTLRRIGSRAVFTRAADWCISDDPSRSCRIRTITSPSVQAASWEKSTSGRVFTTELV